MKSCVRLHNGAPMLFINDEPNTGAMVYAASQYMADFAAAGLHINNIVCDTCDWWTGPDEYDFSALDKLFEEYIAVDPDVLFFPRVCIGYIEEKWWGEFAPDEWSQARYIANGTLLNLYGDRSRARGSGASFASDAWIGNGERAISRLVEHLESGPYAERVVGYHIGASITGEWFAWNTFDLDCIEDYSKPMLRYYRAWLTHKYGTSVELQKAWQDNAVKLETAEIPPPASVEGERGYLTADQRIIDYRTCFSACTATAVKRLTHAAKAACRNRKVTGVFFGYYWPHRNITNPARAGHGCLRTVMEMDSVDIIISPSHYDKRGIGGYMDAQSLPDAVRQHGKLFLHEIDTPTCFNRIELRPWMAHFVLPDTIKGSIDIMKRDWAAAVVKRAGYWWMDLHDDGWFHDPELVGCMKRLRECNEELLRHEWRQTSQVAVVLSEESCYRQKLHGTQRYNYLTVLRQWSLARAGYSFDTILLADVLAGRSPVYRLYLFPDMYYVAETERAELVRRLEEYSSMAFFFHAPGCMSERGCSQELMAEIVGVPCMALEVLSGIVEIGDCNDPLLKDIPAGTVYGAGVDREEIDRRSVHAELSIDNAVIPAFIPVPGQGDVLGFMQNTSIPGLIRLRRERGTILYSYAPAPPWQLMRNTAREAGVHIWCESGDVVYADNRMVAIHATSDGEKVIRFPGSADIKDAYSGKELGSAIDRITLSMKTGQTEMVDYKMVDG